MYRPKKKKVVDPNAPPRPNLLSHDKVIRDQKLAIEKLEHSLAQVTRRVDELERKLTNQTAYLSQVHQVVSSKLKK